MNKINLPEDCAKQWELLLLLLSSEEKKIDKTSENEIDMMTYFYKNEGVRKIMQQWIMQMQTSYARATSDDDTALKDDNISLLWRQRGNERFRSNEVLHSYNCYTKSVLYAVKGGEMYPLALANRSATLVRLKRFEDCLTDIQLALDSGYPQLQQHKLYLRQADCYIELRQTSKARKSISTAVSYAQYLKTSLTNTNEFEKHLKNLEKKLELAGDVNVEVNNEIVLPDCHLGKSPQFVSASSALELRSNATSGRHVVARSELRRGDVLFVEEPYAFVALPLDEGLYPVVCETCCQSHINPVPCWCCSRSIYCGEICRRRGWDSFHRWECVGAQSRIWPTIGIAHLAIRVLLMSTSNGFPAIEMGENPRPVTVADVYASYARHDPVSVYSASTPSFFRIFNLVTNFDKMSNTDYIQYALTAVMLTTYLERCTEYMRHFPSALPFPMGAEQSRLLVASLLLRHLGQLVSNGHAVVALLAEDDVIVGDVTRRSPGGVVGGEREVRLATALYPAASMMNHACDPNIVHAFAGRRLVVRSARGVAAGAELFNCYGPHRAREPATHRRAALRAQYMFHCACTACKDDTEHTHDFALLFTAYACQSCKGPVLVSGRRPMCQQCRSADFNLERAINMLHRADDLAKHAETSLNIEERCDKLQSSLKLKQQVLHRHHSALREAADTLASIYAEMGEYTKSIELIKMNIPSLEYQFGSFSVEVAHELRKLSDVMLQRIITSPQHSDFREWCMESHKIIKKALQLLELNYGGWEPIFKRLREQEAFVGNVLAERRAVSADHQSIHNMLHYNLKI